MSLPRRIISPEECGFDYAQAIRELNRLFSYEEIGLSCGYAGREGINDIVNRGRKPSHEIGEAIYILYVETFNRKPPAKRAQSSAQAATT